MPKAAWQLSFHSYHAAFIHAHQALGLGSSPACCTTATPQITPQRPGRSLLDCPLWGCSAAGAEEHSGIWLKATFIRQGEDERHSPALWSREKRRRRHSTTPAGSRAVLNALNSSPKLSCTARLYKLQPSARFTGQAGRNSHYTAC